MAEIDEAEVRRLVREAVERVLGVERAPGSRSAAAPSPAPRAPGARPSPAAATSSAAPPTPARKVAMGADHGGFALKESLKRFLEEELRFEVVDCGTDSAEPVDYPDFAAAVAREVASGRCARGIVVDAAGIGSTMAANKVSGVRCALCHDLATVTNSREHNDANLLALGAKVVNAGMARRLVQVFLTTAFAGGRHERRVQKIMKLDSPPAG